MVILKDIKNYDVIVNYVYSSDYITKMIIDYYREFVLNKNNNKKKIINLDKVVYEYLYNSEFNNYVKDNIDNIFLSDIEKYIKKLYKEFNKKGIKKETRWL